MKIKTNKTRIAVVLSLGLMGLGNSTTLLAANAADEPMSAIAASNTAYTMDQLIALVLTHNPELQQAMRGKDQAMAAITTARALPNPTLEIMQGRQRPVNTGFSGNVNGYMVGQLIENPFLRTARSEAAEFGFTSRSSLLDLTRAAVMARTRLLGYELLLRMEEARAALDELSVLEQIRDRVKVRVESGEAPRYEAIKAEAEFISARQRQQVAKLAVEQSRIAINQMAAGMLPGAWTLSADLNDSPVWASTPPDRLADTLQNNPEIRALNAEMQSSEARIRQAKASVLPGVELRYNSGKDPDNRQDVFGAVVQIPLLDQKQGPRQEATAEFLRAKARLEGRRSELKLQLDAAWMTLEMANLRVEALSKGAIRDAEAALQVAQAAYRFGERGILDVLDAQRVLRNVRADLLAARYQKHAAAIEIELLTGKQAYPSAKKTTTE